MILVAGMVLCCVHVVLAAMTSNWPAAAGWLAALTWLWAAEGHK